MIRRLDVDLDGVFCDHCGARIRGPAATRALQAGDDGPAVLCGRCDGPDEAQDRADALDAQEAVDRAVDAYERWIVRGGER